MSNCTFLSGMSDDVSQTWRIGVEGILPFEGVSNYSNGEDRNETGPWNCSDMAGLQPVKNNGDSLVPEPPMYIMICVSMFYIAIFILGVIGNCLVIIVIWRNADMRTTTNYFLVNLSVADLLVLLVCMPPSFVDLFTKEVWVFGPVMCEYILVGLPDCCSA